LLLEPVGSLVLLLLVFVQVVVGILPVGFVVVVVCLVLVDYVVVVGCY